MNEVPSHESPIYLRLRADSRTGAVLAAFLERPEVCQYQLPAPWCLEEAGIAPEGFLGATRTVTRPDLPELIEALERLCDAPALERACRRMWSEVPEAVRDFYLRRGTLRTMAAIFKLAPASKEVGPPPGFLEDRAKAWCLAIEYRLAAESAANRRAPPEEGSLVYYPFDPQNAAAREELGLEAGYEVILEAFAYDEGRARHREVFERFAREYGIEVSDPAG